MVPSPRLKERDVTDFRQPTTDNRNQPFIFRVAYLATDHSSTMASLFGKRKRRRRQEEHPRELVQDPRKHKNEETNDDVAATFQDTDPLPPWSSLEDLGYE